jgi:proton-translocating NAD(P)+ transhydrogenase subunit alpha
MIVGVLKESMAGERRVALIPASIQPLQKIGLEILVEKGAGTAAGFPDAEYIEKGARLLDRAEIIAKAEIILMVNAPGVNPEAAKVDLEAMKAGQVLIGMHDPLGEPAQVKTLADRGLTAFSLELIPRITRAQSMDVLSSMATIAGYRAVLMAAEALPRMFPMMMTAAGTLKPAKVFIVGAGVAGLQAIASAKRLGAIVSAYDVRPAVAEQVQSLGGRFVEFDLDTGEAEDSGGYAKESSEEFLRKQQSEMARVVAENDVVITTAAIPGKTSPVLVTAEMVKGMQPGSVIVDLAAERGGNCELTRAGEVVVEHGVTILGPLNTASDTPYHASQMFAKNVVTYLQNMVDEGALDLDMTDEVIADTLLCRDGDVVNPRVRDLLGLPAVANKEETD